jgi:hypothetical protein
MLVQASSKYNLLWDKIAKRKMKTTPQQTDRPKAFHRIEAACEALGRAGRKGNEHHQWFGSDGSRRRGGKKTERNKHRQRAYHLRRRHHRDSSKLPWFGSIASREEEWQA